MCECRQGLADSASQCDDDCDTGIEYEGEYHYQGDDDDVDDTMESLEVPTVNSARELLLLGQTDPTRTVSSQDGLEVAPNNAELEAGMLQTCSILYNRISHFHFVSMPVFRHMIYVCLHYAL